MNNYPTNTKLWARIEPTLDERLPDWRSRIEHFGQVSAIEDRLSGKTCDDNEIQEGLVKAVLSSNTDWAKIDGVLPELHQLFHNFSLEYYAQLAHAEQCNLASLCKERSWTFELGVNGSWELTI